MISRVILTVITAATMLAGCVAVGDGAAPARPAGSSSFVPSLAPPVPDARDLRGVAACDLLAGDQRERIGIDSSTETRSADGVRGCLWRSTDGEGALSTVAVQDPPAGLEGLYMVRGTYAVFEPGYLGGQPIVRADFVDTDDRDCRIFIGVADDQMLQAAAGFPFEPGRGCEVAREMASAMIANLPAPN